MTRRQKVTGTRRVRTHSHRNLTLESLETRNLLSTIDWVNRGTSELDTDRFGQMFGSQAELARSIVDQAISDWESTIQDFRYSTHADNRFSLDLSAAGLAEGILGVTRGIQTEPGGKPYQATIELDDDAAGCGWLFQLETGTLLQYDFYATVAHEIGHAVGINWELLESATLVGPDPHDDSASLYQLQLADDTKVTLTGSPEEGLHIFEDSHPYDLMNSGRAGDYDQRQCISDLDAQVLSHQYGYDIALPSDTDTVQISNDNGTLAVLGTEGADTISIVLSGTKIQVLANAQAPVEFAAHEIDAVRIYGKGGDDVLSVDAMVGCRVGIDGGNGNDMLTGGSASNTLVGGAGNDLLTGSGDRDTLNGGGGNDVLHGGAGNDVLFGAAGDDRYVFGMITASEMDVLIELADEGQDTLDYSALTAPAPVTVNLSDSLLDVPDSFFLSSYVSADGQQGAFAVALNQMEANFENIIGGGGNDHLTGNDAANQLTGGAGNDLLEGRAGDDRICGGTGNDQLQGGDGRDELFGDAGNDFLAGGRDGSRDKLTGGAGVDTFEQYYTQRLTVSYTLVPHTYYSIRRIPYWNPYTRTMSYMYSISSFTYYTMVPRATYTYSAEDWITDYDPSEDLIES